MTSRGRNTVNAEFSIDAREILLSTGLNTFCSVSLANIVELHYFQTFLHMSSQEMPGSNPVRPSAHIVELHYFQVSSFFCTRLIKRFRV